MTELETSSPSDLSRQYIIPLTISPVGELIESLEDPLKRRTRHCRLPSMYTSPITAISRRLHDLIHTILTQHPHHPEQLA
jgi:hypothetical protein